FVQTPRISRRCQGLGEIGQAIKVFPKPRLKRQPANTAIWMHDRDLVHEPIEPLEISHHALPKVISRASRVISTARRRRRKEPWLHVSLITSNSSGANGGYQRGSMPRSSAMS